jgi:hypothetical protein
MGGQSDFPAVKEPAEGLAAGCLSAIIVILAVWRSSDSAGLATRSGTRETDFVEELRTVVSHCSM